jgi:hypothetical protein
MLITYILLNLTRRAQQIHLDLLYALTNTYKLREWVDSERYDMYKRCDFNFHITKIPFIYRNISAAPAYEVYISQLIWDTRSSVPLARMLNNLVLLHVVVWFQWLTFYINDIFCLWYSNPIMWSFINYRRTLTQPMHATSVKQVLLNHAEFSKINHHPFFYLKSGLSCSLFPIIYMYSAI